MSEGEPQGRRFGFRSRRPTRRIERSPLPAGAVAAFAEFVRGAAKLIGATVIVVAAFAAIWPLGPSAWTILFLVMLVSAPSV